MTPKMLDAKIICEDLLACYSDDTSRSLGLETAQILCGLSMSHAVIRCGFVGRLRHMDGGLSDETLKHLSVEEMALIEDLDKIGLIDTLHTKQSQNTERLRQMLLAMANDVRVIVIKLALQLVAMRHLPLYHHRKQHSLALQTRDILAPLANRLGIAKLKWELEDLALKALEPTTYHLIASSLAEQRRTRETFINGIVVNLQKAMVAEGIKNTEVYGRAKHINSIFNKMKKKNKRLEEIYDLLAIRVQVDSLKDCYSILGIVHALWKHIPSEFDDYIANPKPNGYQSLHTAVVGPEKKTIEVQIRTHEMHDYAEFGIAAHWRYKEDNTQNISAFEKQINWLRTLISEPDEAIVDEFTSEIKEDRVYVLTPQGKVIDLPTGATPLDFAYHIHTELGHQTNGARVNGHFVPITQTLCTGDTIEILTQKTGKPSRDWINPSAGYLKSPRALAKVRHFFKQLERGKAIEEGQALLEKATKKFKINLKRKYLQQASEKFNFNDIENLYAAIGFGDVGLASVRNYIEEIRDDKNEDLDDIATRLARIPIKPIAKARHNVMIEGIDDLLISMASCCSPVPPEAITGYITKTKGVRVHRSNCHNLLTMKAREPEKIMVINWSDGQVNMSSAILIQAHDRVGLIRDIVQVIANEGVGIQKANLGRDNEQNISLQLQISIKNTQQINLLINKIDGVKNVRSAIRIMSTA